MENQSLLVSQIRQRLEILYQMVNELETGGGGSGDAYTKAQTDALLNGKVDKVAGSSLMTTAQANKLAGIESGAEVNVQADWDQTDTTADDFIKNKPVIPDTSDFYTKTEVDAELSGKVDKQTGYSLISDTNITKLNGIAAGAEVNVQANWNETDTTADSYILNKPTIPDLTNYYNKTETEAEIQGAITDLDVPSTSTTGHYIKSIAQTDGLIEAVAELADTTAGNGSTRLITSGAVYTGLSSKASATDQAIDRAALVELVDGGAKNLSNWYTGTAAIDGTTIATAVPITYQSGDFVFSYDTSLTTGSITIGFRNASDTLVGSVQVDNATKVKVAAIPEGAAKFNVFAGKAGTYSNFMICSKADWDISHEFQPYRPTYQELYEMVQALQPAQT